MRSLPHYPNAQAPAEDPQGEIFGLLGHNGAGKSTMTKILTGRAKPTSGRAQVLGRDVPGELEAVRGEINLVAETPNVYQRASAKENLEFFCSLYGLLDPQSARDLRKIVTALAEGGSTIFLTTHDMNEADELCERVAFLVPLLRVRSSKRLAAAPDRLLVTVSSAGDRLAVGADEPAGEPPALCGRHAHPLVRLGSLLTQCLVPRGRSDEVTTSSAWLSRGSSGRAPAATRLPSPSTRSAPISVSSSSRAPASPGSSPDDV